MKTFKEYISEVSKGDAAEKYGKILFGDFRKKKESDTEAEKKLFKALQAYYIRYEKMDLDTIKELIKIRKHYPDILKPKKKIKYVYRTTTETKKKQHKLLSQKYKLGKEYKLKVKKSSIFHNNEMLELKGVSYKPHNNMQSWSTDLEWVNFFKPLDPDGFDGDEIDITELNSKVVYKTKVDDTFFFDPEFVDDINGYSEYEVTRFSMKKSIDSTLFINANTFFQKTEEGKYIFMGYNYSLHH